jgi:ribonuclease PH
MRPDTGILRVNYNMMPFSGQGERVRPGQNRRARELSMVSEKALMSVVDLTKFKNTGVDVLLNYHKLMLVVDVQVFVQLQLHWLMLELS